MRLRFLPLSLLLLLASTASALRQSSISYPQPGLTVSTRSVHYKIRGSTAAALRAQMDRRSPVDRYTGKHYDAFANWVTSWRYRYATSAGKCRITSASVLVELKYTYPRWLRAQRVSPALVSAWRHYLKVLHKHENGHGAIAVRVGGDVLSSIGALAPRRYCWKLATAADQVGANGIERTNTLQRAYDDRTDHGATQGARFP